MANRPREGKGGRQLPARPVRRAWFAVERSVVAPDEPPHRSLILTATLKWVTFPYSSERFDTRSLLLQAAVPINLESSLVFSPRTPC